MRTPSGELQINKIILGLSQKGDAAPCPARHALWNVCCRPGRGQFRVWERLSSSLWSEVSHVPGCPAPLVFTS